MNDGTQAKSKEDPTITNSHDLCCASIVLIDSSVVDLLCRSVFSTVLASVVTSGRDASSRDRAEVTAYLGRGVRSLVTPGVCWCAFAVQTVHVLTNVEMLC